MCITGHIYKIIHLDSSITYIGSTCDSISGRWRTHKSGYKNWLNNKEKYSTIAIYPYFEQYGIDRFKMILIKSIDIVDKTHLRVYEQLAINRTKCCNTIASLQLLSKNCLSKHYYQSISTRKKQYHEANREKDLERMKTYREANKESISEQKKQYHEANKQTINDQKKIKIQCECGVESTKSHFARHRKSAKCIAALAALSN